MDGISIPAMALAIITNVKPEQYDRSSEVASAVNAAGAYLAKLIERSTVVGPPIEGAPAVATK